MTVAEFLRKHPQCAYCGTKAIHRDHVVPVAMRRRHHIEAYDVRFWVAACGPCNWRKSTRKYYPKGFDISILPGKGWQQWDGKAQLEVRR